jgi:hypothetical protein
MVSVDKSHSTITDAVYATVFLQPARLVSHLLRTPQAVHYFLAMIHTVPHRSEFDKVPAGTARHRYRELEDIHTLRGSDYVLVERTLGQVARTITWGAREMIDYGETCTLPRILSNSCIFSAHSVININKCICQALIPIQGDRQRLNLQFLLATTMIHELAHATMHALTEMPLEHEHCFGECGSGEAGWELEARLFGLCPSERKVLSGELWWYELGVGQNTHLQPVPIERVQIDFIQKLFTNQFWNHQFTPQEAWSIVPAMAWPPVVYVPDSVDALIQTAMAQSRRRPITKVKASTKKRKRTYDDDEDDY